MSPNLGHRYRRGVARLVYSAITSLDGYVADADGNFDWAEPDAEVHAFVNDLERPIGTYLYGRRLYEVMQVWETLGDRSRRGPGGAVTSPRSGGRPTRSCTRRTLDAVSTPGPGSSGRSTPTRCGR